MIRSGEFWLNCLSDDIKEKWLNNYDPMFICSLEEMLNRELSFEYFIIQAFHLIKTPEGYDFWRDMSYTEENKLIQQLRNNKLKQLGIK